MPIAAFIAMMAAKKMAQQQQVNDTSAQNLGKDAQADKQGMDMELAQGGEQPAAVDPNSLAGLAEARTKILRQRNGGFYGYSGI
jgi:hypothetical protein